MEGCHFLRPHLRARGIAHGVQRQHLAASHADSRDFAAVGYQRVKTFCDVAQIPAMYYEKPYYLAAAKGGDKVYSLLRQALEATDKVAVATFVMHQRQHLCAISPQGKSLMLLTLRFADEVLPASGSSSTTKISSAELAMAKQLVQSMQGNFSASKFKDTYRAVHNRCAFR